MTSPRKAKFDAILRENSSHALHVLYYRTDAANSSVRKGTSGFVRSVLPPDAVPPARHVGSGTYRTGDGDFTSQVVRPGADDHLNYKRRGF